jgi:hypothetical protein
VWFSDDYLPVTTPGSLAGLHSWLGDVEQRALFGYNHPGANPAGWAGSPRRRTLPATCTRAWWPWRPSTAGTTPLRRVRRRPRSRSWTASTRAGGGLIGCSDEHGRSYGLAGKGRTGLWVREHSRNGVREALTARRTFATREVGLRLDATLGGVRMGSVAPHLAGSSAELVVDLEGSTWQGHAVKLQLLTSDRARLPRPERSGARRGDAGVVVLEQVSGRVGEVTTASIDSPRPRLGDPSRCPRVAALRRAGARRAPRRLLRHRLREPLVPRALTAPRRVARVEPAAAGARMGAMQTFLPFPSFERSADVLDSPRLGKQRVETLQVLRALELPEYGWSSHPAVQYVAGADAGARGVRAGHGARVAVARARRHH